MTGKRLLTALMVFALLVASVGPAVGAGPADAGATVVASHDDEYDGHYNKSLNDTEPAEDAYVTADGDVVLLYDYAADGEVPDKEVSGHAGVDVPAGLAHVDVAKSVDSNVTGNLTLTADRESVSADGRLAAPRPDALDSLQFEYVARQNDSDSAASMDLDASVSLSGQAGFLALLKKAEANGFVTSGPTSLDSNGSFVVESVIGMQTQRQHHFVLTESAGDYELDAEESFPVPQFAAGDWANASAAESTLQERYCEPFEATDASCSVAVGSFARSDGQITVEYTATMDGVDEAVSNAIVEGLTGPETNVSQDAAEGIADHVGNVTLSRVEAEFDVSGTSATFTWNVSMDDSDDLALAYADLLEQFETSVESGMAAPGGPETAMFGGPFGSSPGELADRLTAQIRAQRAAGFGGTTTWNAVLTTSGRSADLEASLDSTTTNWADYVTELEARGVNASGASETVLEARTDGDQVILTGSVDAQSEDMFERGLAAYERSVTRMADRPGKVSEAFDTVRQANFTRARMDVTLTTDEFAMEGAVAVENGSALVAELPDPLSKLSSSYTDFDDLRTTVRLENAVSDPSDPDEVRALPFVGENTTVHRPGDWNRNFESMDTRRVRSYLGLADASSDLPMIDVATSAMEAVEEINELLFGSGS